MTSFERNGVTAGALIGFVAGYVLGWGFLPVCIAVGYAVGHFWGKKNNAA